MISLAENKEQLLKITDNDPFGTRIQSLYELYKNTLGFYVWSNESAAFSLNSSVMTICGEIKNADEFFSFLSMTHPMAIMCREELAKELGFNLIQKGELMYKKTDLPIAEIQQSEIKLRDFYDLFTENNMPLDYEGFCLDAAYSLRHCGGAATEIYEDKVLVAGAIATSVTKNSAIINAVAARKKRMGYGKRVMADIEAKLWGRTLYIFKEINVNNEFYNSLGYKPMGNWAVAEKII